MHNIICVVFSLSMGSLRAFMTALELQEQMPVTQLGGKSGSGEGTLTILTPVSRERVPTAAHEGGPMDEAVPTTCTGVGQAWV